MLRAALPDVDIFLIYNFAFCTMFNEEYPPKFLAHKKKKSPLCYSLVEAIRIQILRKCYTYFHALPPMLVSSHSASEVGCAASGRKYQPMSAGLDFIIDGDNIIIM